MYILPRYRSSTRRTLLSGFTLVEITVAVALMAMFTLVGTSVFSSVRNAQELQTAKQDVVLALNSARESTLRSLSDKSYGVIFSNSGVIRFTSTYTAGTSSNITFSFPSSVSATTSLSGGTTTILFTRLTGQPSATGTITVTEGDSGAVATVHIDTSGVITVQ